MRLGTWLVRGFLALVVLLAVALSLTVGWRPFIGPEARPLTGRKFERTPQRLERGRYIATALSGCIYCHSPHEWTAAGTPIIAGGEGSGEVMPYGGLPGQVVAPNLTADVETGAGSWSDDALARAIREGIGHDGRALFPMMPYPRFRTMSDEDVASVVVYLRSLPALRRSLPKTEIIFPVKYLIRSAPKPVTEAIPGPPAGDGLTRGAHLMEQAGCADCHTPQDRGQSVPGMELAGGTPLIGPWGTVASANITQDAGGIPYYDEALFLQVMRTGYVKARLLSPIMPVMAYKKLSDEDLKAMFTYLRTVKPVRHRVDNSETPTLCKLCRQKHGAGDQN
jgi:mono/diheme cytochrome c family protein